MGVNDVFRSIFLEFIKVIRLILGGFYLLFLLPLFLLALMWGIVTNIRFRIKLHILRRRAMRKKGNVRIDDTWLFRRENPLLYHKICDHVNTRAAKKAIPLIKRKYPYLPLWMINASCGGLTVFFEKESQAAAYAASAYYDWIKRDYYNFLEKFDEFGVFADYKAFYVKFDSKEVLDRDYDGNLWSYYR